MGELSGEQKPYSLQQELKETEKDWPENHENSFLHNVPFKYRYDWITAWRQWLSQSCFSLRVYNENLTQDNSWYIMAMELFTPALSVPLFLNSMSPPQTNACL